MNKQLFEYHTRVNGKMETILVRIVGGNREHRFTARWKNVDSEKDIVLDDTDIEKLKKRMQKRLEDRYTFDWKKVLRVTVEAGVDDLTKENFSTADPTRPRIIPHSANVTLKIEELQLTTDRAGDKLHRCGPHQAPCPGWPHEGDPPRFGGGDVSMAAIIDDNPANREALSKIFDGFEALKVRLVDLLSPQQINKTLSTVIAGGRFLPAPMENK